MPEIEVILLIAAAVVLTAVISVLLTARNMRRKAAYMLDALEDKELNFRFNESRRIGRRFNKTLNRMRAIFDKERKEIAEQDRYFGLMLDHVRTGVCVIDGSGRVTYSNRTALIILGLSSFNHIRQLRPISDSLYDAFVGITEESHEQRADFYNESGKVTISLTASSTSIRQTNVKVVAFNDITHEISENEQESWSKLIRVLTHEIMNTVTPVASLSETLLKFDGINGEIRSGLDTIHQSSKGLIKFVENYRNLTRVAVPVKSAFYLRELAERVMNLTKEQVNASGAECIYIEKSEDILLYADQGQICQILINLVKNAIQAEATKINITAEINISEHVIINVTNNGRPISKESSDQIFVPFYTTKQDGTGIGLSLSRQIMRLHNGTISLTRSDDNGTVFTLIFR